MARHADKAPKLKRGELRVHEVVWTKADFEKAPDAHRSFYFLIAQVLNECAMLQSLTLRAMHGIKGPRATQETSLGLTILLLRLLSGRIYEISQLINNPNNNRILSELYEIIPATNSAKEHKTKSEKARKKLNIYFNRKSPLIKLIRHKLSNHLDQAILDEAFKNIPDDIRLTDFYTGSYGTTFFGGADTIAAYAISDLAGTNNLVAGIQKMFDDALDATGALFDFGDGIIFAFSLAYLDQKNLFESSADVLRNLPESKTASIGFFMSNADIRGQQNRASGRRDEKSRP